MAKTLHEGVVSLYVVSILYTSVAMQPSSLSVVEPGQLSCPCCSAVARMQTEGSKTGFEVHAVMVSVAVTPPPSY